MMYLWPQMQVILVLVLFDLRSVFQVCHYVLFMGLQGWVGISSLALEL